MIKQRSEAMEELAKSAGGDSPTHEASPRLQGLSPSLSSKGGSRPPSLSIGPSPLDHRRKATHGTMQFMLSFHTIFVLACGISLAPCLIDSGHAMGHTVGCLVVGWNVFIAAYAWKRNDDGQLWEAWRFLACLSPLMVIPDWFLVVGLRTLQFPPDGAYRIGDAVSWYMAGMWSIPLLWVLTLCPGRKEPTMRELTLAALLSLVLLGASEQLTVPLNLWVCTPAVKNVLGHVAVYVLPAEAALGPAVLVAHRMTCSRGLTTQFVAAVLVMLIYAGALAVSFLFLEAH